MIILYLLKIIQFLDLREMQIRNIHSYLAQNNSKIIIDTHGGLEDVVALMFCIRLAKKFNAQIIGITTVNGRRNIQDATTDALLALKLAEASIPIYKGATQSMMLKKQYPQCINLSQDHSQLQQLKKQFLTQEDHKLIQTENAYKFLVQSSKKYKCQLCIITFGPLTNLALAGHLNPAIRQIGRFSISGGQFSAISNVVGETCAEANFLYDPESALFILKTFGKNKLIPSLYLNPIQHSLQFDWMEAIDNAIKSQNISKNIKNFLEISKTKCPKYYLNASLLTAMVVFCDSFLTKYYQVYSEVCLDQKSKGFLAIDWLRMDLKHEKDRKANIRIYQQFDKKALIKQISQLY